MVMGLVRQADGWKVDVKAPDRKVLVGWFGPIELPFVLKRIGNDWKIEPLPYFALMEQ
jgi:hypothetical protein